MLAENNTVESWKLSRNCLLGLAFVVSIASVVFFKDLGAVPLFNPDEALYAEPAREMLVTGEYITTLLNYVVRFTKPPLCIWAMAGCFQIFGVNEFAARFFGAACGVILIAATYFAIARYISLRAALVGALTLASAPLFVFTGREAITDMPLSLFGAGSQLAFFHAGQAQVRSRAALYLGYVLIGLAVMTKGPVGLVLPVAILCAWHFLKGDLWTAFKNYRPLTGAAIVAAISLPWFITEIVITHGAYFQEFIIRENFQRFTAVVDNHKQPVYYHLLAMAGGFFPWAVYLPQSLVAALAPYFSALKPVAGESAAATSGSALIAFLKGRMRQSQLYLTAVNDSTALALYCIIWATVTLVFYSASVSKLLPYTLSAFPALAIVVAWELERCFVRQEHGFKRLAMPLIFVVLAYGAVSTVAPVVAQKVRDAPLNIAALITAYAAAQAALVLVSLIVMRTRRLFAGALVLAAGAALLLIIHAGRVLPVLSAKLEGPLPKYAYFAGQSKDAILVFDMRKPGVPFYALRQVENINGIDALNARLKQVPQAYILTKSSKLTALKDLPGMKVIASEGDYAMVRFGAGGTP